MPTFHIAVKLGVKQREGNSVSCPIEPELTTSVIEFKVGSPNGSTLAKDPTWPNWSKLGFAKVFFELYARFLERVCRKQKPQAGFEPTTFRLLSECSTPKLLRHVKDII